MTDETAPTEAVQEIAERNFARAQAIYGRFLDYLESQQDRVLPDAQRAAFTAKFMPILAKQMEKAQFDSKLDEVREAHFALLAEIRDALTPNHPFTPDGDEPSTLEEPIPVDDVGETGPSDIGQSDGDL